MSNIEYKSIEKLRLLKNNIESFTSKTYNNLTEAVQELKNKYGKKPEKIQEISYDTNGTHILTPDEGYVMSGAIINIDIKNAETVDGWHVSIREDGTPPPNGTENTITFVYNKG